MYLKVKAVDWHLAHHNGSADDDLNRVDRLRKAGHLQRPHTVSVGAFHVLLDDFTSAVEAGNLQLQNACCREIF